MPDAVKIAVIADPQTGFNANESYTPGNTLELRRASDHSVAFSAAPSVWKNGTTDAVSGDKAWWFDFSNISVSGEYYVFDPANNTRSESFRVTQNNALCATATLQPPLNQPAMKSYKDWNTSWPQNSWQVTEPAICYQAAYVRLLSKFVQSVSVAEVPTNFLDFKLSPNPAGKTCEVWLGKNASGGCTVRLLNAAGQVLLERQMAEGTPLRLDLAGLPPGIYFVQVQTAQQSGMQRLAVQ